MNEASAAARSGGRLAAWLTLVGALTLLNYGSRAAAGDVERDALYRWEVFAGALIQFGVMLVIVLAIARGGPARELLGLRRATRWGRATLIAVVTLIATYVVGAVVSGFANVEDEQGLVPEGWDPDRAAPFIANFVVVSAYVPVIEELTFRGLGFTLLAARVGRGVTLVAIGVLFGLAHGLLLGLPILIAFGIGLAWLRSTTDSVYPCIALHAFFNASSLLLSVTVGGD